MDGAFLDFYVVPFHVTRLHSKANCFIQNGSSDICPPPRLEQCYLLLMLLILGYGRSAKEYQFCLIYKRPQTGRPECYNIKIVGTKCLHLLTANGIMIPFSASGDDLPKAMFRIYKPLLLAADEATVSLFLSAKHSYPLQPSVATLFDSVQMVLPKRRIVPASQTC